MKNETKKLLEYVIFWEAKSMREPVTQALHHCSLITGNPAPQSPLNWTEDMFCLVSSSLTVPFPFPFANIFLWDLSVLSPRLSWHLSGSA